MNDIKRVNHHRGFSLVEMIIYLAITITIAGALVSSYLSLNTVLLRNKTERALTNAASVTLERMVRAIQHAEAIDGTQSTFNSANGVLTLTETGTTTKFYLTNGRVRMDVNGTSVGQLTSDAVLVRSLTFNRFVGSEGDLVRVALTMTATSSSASSTRTYYVSGVLRDAYE